MPETIDIRLCFPAHMISDFMHLGAYLNSYNRFWYIKMLSSEIPIPLIQDYTARRIELDREHLEVFRESYDMKYDISNGYWYIANKHYRKLVMF